MIGTILFHVSRTEKVRVLTEPFLHSLNGSEKSQTQVVLVEYLQGASASKLEIIPVDHLPTNWKVAWEEDLA